jgi:hypothetical protein
MKSRSLLRAIGRGWFIFVCVALFAISALAQGTSIVRGTIKDQQGNVVSGASVKLTNMATNVSRTTTSSDAGVFSFEAVPVGDYKVEVEASGFKKSVITDVHAIVSTPASVDVQLEIGAVTESVTISAGSSELLINREDATLGTPFVNRQITQLPLEARNVPSLLTLQTATTRTGYVAGARADQSNITLDGVDINEAQTNSIVSGDVDPANSTDVNNLSPANNTVLRLNAEAIEEFRVTTVNANANQGRSSGAQVSLVTKGGSNDWHGALFEFYRTSAFSANNFFNNKAGHYAPNDPSVLKGVATAGEPKVPRAPLIRHTFGGALGGPIKKDTAFFFYSFEGDRITQSSSVVRNVPLASLGEGQVKFLNPSGGVTTLTTAQLITIFNTPGGGVNPAAVAALKSAAAKYPANDFTVGDQFNSAGFRFNAPVPVDRNSHAAKFDFNLTSKQQAFVRANVIYDLLTREQQFPDTPSPTIWSHPIGFAGGHTWTMTNTLVNTFRYGFTREAFTQQGDSTENSISFRFIFSPVSFTRTLERITPVHNFTDDISWVKGNHSLGFGANVRLISNQRTSFGKAFDSAITNPSFFSGGGNSISNRVINAGFPISGSRVGVQNAATALIGRFSQYTANFTYDIDGNIVPSGTPTARDFRTQEYDAYVQDSWKMSPNFTLTYGMRYTISRPVYEKEGFETTTDIPLGEVFRLRQQASARGQNYADPLTLVRSGPANNGPYMYDWDKNNFQPRIAFAWSPNFENGFLKKLFGDNKSVFRGGFAITNDYYGQQLAVSFDLNNAIGFTGSQTIAANTYSVTSTNPSRAAPLFAGFGQNVRSLPRIVVPPTMVLSQPFEPNPIDQQARIESTLDSELIAPTNYSWNFTYERELPKGLVVQTSYIGRRARNLIASRDVMALNNLVDPTSLMDWYSAAGTLEQFRLNGTPISAIPKIAWFENLLPTNIASLMEANYFGGTPSSPSGVFPTLNLTATQAVYAVALNFYDNDWTDTQDVIEDGLERNIFFHPQYGALSAFASIANSNYDAGTLSIRQRLGRSLTMDFNYTLSHSLDDASGLQTSGAFGGAFILNPLRQHDSYGNSDFDIRHIINTNAVWEVPFGRGRRFFNGVGKVGDAILGGWQFSGIMRWNSGEPIFSPYDDARWATNWNVQSSGVRVRPVTTCPVQGEKLFGDCLLQAYSSFRGAFPGETGDRNVIRLPGYFNLDLGLGKSFTMPWSENHQLQVRFEAFNVTNTQRMGAIDTSRSGFGLQTNSSQITDVGDIPTNWSNFTAIQGQPRVMQLGVRYRF